MKLDTSTIEGYESMSTEEKLKALESYVIPEPDYSGYVKKDVFDKTASELSAKKRELQSKLTEDEAVKQQEAEKWQDLQERYDKLLRENEVSKYKANLLGLGYDDKLAAETAEAMAKGDTDKVFANQKKHQEAVEKSIRTEVLKQTPAPVGDGKADMMTLEKLKAMDELGRLAFSKEHADEYKQLYSGGNE